MRTVFYGGSLAFAGNIGLMTALALLPSPLLVAVAGLFQIPVSSVSCVWRVVALCCTVQVSSYVVVEGNRVCGVLALSVAGPPVLKFRSPLALCKFPPPSPVGPIVSVTSAQAALMYTLTSLGRSCYFASVRI